MSIFIFLLFTFILANPISLNTSPFSSVTTYISLGDSYASGNGAGHPIPAFALCGRFTAAYPVQLAKILSPVRFHSLACGGASIRTVIGHQFSWIGPDTDLVTLTVGGNEADFFSVLNECVYRWHPRRTCEAELRKSKELMESSGFVERYAEMVRVGVDRMKESRGGRFLVTGYARFFNETTRECDGVTFGKRGSRQYLTRFLRRELNELVGMLNHVIRSAAEAYGAEYVDVDGIFEGHRFCEEGVNEPDLSRTDTWFFNLDYDSDNALAEKSGAGQDGYAQKVLSVGFGKGFADFTRVFHPTEQGHGGISDAIAKHLQRERNRGLCAGS